MVALGLKELDARIDGFLKAAQAVVFGPNPAYTEKLGELPYRYEKE